MKMDKPEMPELPELPESRGLLKAQEMQEAPRPRERLIQARTQRKLSQRQVAERLETTHINVSRWERGITKPNPFFRRRLVQLFGKTEEELDLADTGGISSNAPSHQTTTAPISTLLDPTIPLLPSHEIVGRESDLARLKKRLCSGRNTTLTALNGLPGVGKTTLSIAIAHDPDVQAYFRDGILWAGLGPEPNMSGIVGHWCSLLGVSQAEVGELNGTEAIAVALHHAIGSRRILLVIDDAWNIEDALALKIGGPNCAHLITTRFPSIANQLGAESAITIRELDERDGVHLLRVLAPQAIEHEAGEALALVKAVGGLPLALTLIGNHLRSHSYSNQPRRVGAALTRLSNASARLHISEQRGPNERHSSLPRGTPISLASVISVTDAQLNAQQRAALHALAVFPPKPDSFSEEAALAVTGGSPDILDALVDAGLLETGEADHYMMHQTIADYARARLEDTGNTAPYERLVRYIATFVSGYKKDYTRLERVSSTIYIALEEAYTSGLSDALMRIIYNFMPYLLSRGLYSVAEKHLRRALEMAERARDGYGKTGALLYLGEIAQKQGNYEQASQQLEDGLALARQVGKPDRIIALLAILGRVTWKRGDYAKAEGYLQEGLNLARSIDDKERLCDILETLGSVAASLGNYHQSMLYMEEALPIAKALEDSEKTCTLLINLGVTEGERGNYEQAEEHFLEGLELAKKIGHREWISLLLSNLGEAESELGHYEQAEDYFKEGLKVAKEIDHREWISGLLSSLGQTARKRRDFNEAKKYLEESMAIAHQINRPQLLSEILYIFGDLYLHLQQPRIAEETFLEMLKVIPEGSQDLVALAQYGLARAVAIQNRVREARELGESSLAIMNTLNHRTTNEVREWLKFLTR